MYIAKFVKNGNIKVGGDIWTFNKLAGNSIIGGCKGTCGKNCKGCWDTENPKKSACYVRKSYIQYGWDDGTVVKSHIANTIAMRTQQEKCFEDLNLQLKRARKKPVAVRLHASGELETVAELKGWCKLASEYPDIPFYVYTKAYDIVDKVLESIAVPKNFYINISIWHENGIACYNKWKKLDNIKAFIYDDGEYDYTKAGIKSNCKCPAYQTINGKTKLIHSITCDKCKICMNNNKRNKIIVCKAH